VGGTGYKDYWPEVTSAFAKSSGINVKFDVLDFTPLVSKEVTLASVKSTQYDIYSTHTGSIAAFFPHFEPLNSHFDASDQADFFSGPLQTFINPATKELAAVPAVIDARSQYYRSDLYQQAGLSPAKTWDDLLKNGQQLTGGGKYGLTIVGKGDPAARQFSDFLWQAGGTFLDEGNNPVFNSSAGVEALTFYRDLIQTHKVTPPDALSYQWVEQTNSFANGSAAAILTWPSGYASFADTSKSQVAGKFATAPLPGYKTQISTASSHGLAINKYSRNKDDAASFLKYVVSSEELVNKFDKYTFFPSRKSSATTVINKAQGPKQSWLQSVQSAAASGREWPTIPQWAQISPIVQSSVERALSGQASVKDALDSAAKSASDVLKK
jgi:ABC-type glycerol-3-phosphate transport system substrate-binding protein